MRNRLNCLLLLAAFVALLAVLVSALFWESEPTFEKKTLSQWLGKYAVHGSGFFMDAASGSREADEAIRQIGTNALPYLVHWLRYEKPPWKSRLQGAIGSIFGRHRPNWTVVDGKEVKAARAMRAFIALGPRADGALRELEALLNDPNALVSAKRAALVLPHIGDAGLAPVLVFLTNQHARLDVRYFVAGEIETVQTNLPALQALLRDSDLRLRVFATNMVWRMIGKGRLQLDQLSVPK